MRDITSYQMNFIGPWDGQGTCAGGEACRYFGYNPFNGTVSFDDLGGALLTTFQCMTLEGWSEVMYMLMEAWSPWSSLYFLALILFGSFYVINLFLAVLWHTYWDMPDAPKDALQDASRDANAVATVDMDASNAVFVGV